MAKLTQTAQSTKLGTAQDTILSAAAQHSEGAILLADRIKGRAAAVMVESLIAKGLVREIRSKPGLPVWRQDKENGKSFALVITKLGRSSAVTQSNVADTASAPTLDHPIAEIRSKAQPSSVHQAEAPPLSKATAPRATSKLAGVIGLLTRDSGASLDALMNATGLLPHTTRAALTGLRKRGYEVTREVHAGTSATYHIRLAPAAKAA